jgi:hypothetical protein
MGLRFQCALRNYNLGVGSDVDVNNPDYDGYAVTPADGTDLPNGCCDAIYVTGTGNVNVNLLSSKTDTGAIAGTAVLTSLAAGSITECSAKRILSTSTTATGIYALYRRG